MTPESTVNPAAKSAGSDESHIRPGEVQVELPASADASLYFIGRIRTPWQARKDCPKNARVSRESGVVCTIEVDPRWAQALPGVETCSHLIVLYWMDRARRDLAVQMPTRAEAGRPTFSVRSPVRPNPIALAVVELRKVEGNTLHVVGVDCLDGTPLLDIKPYFATTDSIPDARAVSHARESLGRNKRYTVASNQPPPAPDQWAEPRGKSCPNFASASPPPSSPSPA